MNLLLAINKAFNKISRTTVKLSFSQCGEDVIMLFLVKALKLQAVTYVEVGTNHPINLNNTYLFYLNGYRGICIEPDISFHTKIKRLRPADQLITAGISVGDGEPQQEFIIMDDPLLNTFSHDEAERLVTEHGRRIRKKLMVDVVRLNQVLEGLYAEKKGQSVILSIDVEGLDLEVLQSIDFIRFRPAIVCAETISFSSNLSGNKNGEILTFMQAKNYSVYADTHINSIFVDNALLNF